MDSFLQHFEVEYFPQAPMKKSLKLRTVSVSILDAVDAN
jgi:hypothetical protein